MGEQGHIKLGDHYYDLVSWDDPNISGLFFRHPPMERDWSSLFASQQTPSGKPSIENLRNDDLRLVLDDLSGGEGQIVQRAGDAVGEHRYARSNGVDLAVPGVMRLERAMLQQGLTGTAGTTSQGSAWADVTGTSTVDGTDRKLNAVNDVIKKSLGVLAAGGWQVDFYAKVNAPALVNGAAFTQTQGTIDTVGDTLVLKTDPTVVDHVDTPPAAARVTLTFTVDLAAIGSPTDANVRYHVLVRNAADDKTLHDSGELVLYASDVGGGPVERSITFEANGSASYIYRVKRVSAYSCNLKLVSCSIDVHDTKTARCIIYDETATAEVANLDVNMDDLTSFQRIAALGFVADGVHTYSMRLKRQAGASRALWCDKGVYTLVGIKNPYLCELGQGNRLWLADWSGSVVPAPSGIFYWDAANNQWQAPGNLGSATNKKPIAMAASDYAEYVLHEDAKVYQCRAGVTPVAYTAAYTNPVGLAVAAARLWVLTEDVANGTRLYMEDVDNATGVPHAVPAVVYTAGGTTGYTTPKAQTAADVTITRRMAPTLNGVTFFVNHGPKCWLYAFDAGTGVGAPVTDFPSGFSGRAIVHALGLSYVGGGFPATDSDGVLRQRPAVFVVDHSTGSAPLELDLRLHRDGDAGSRIMDMQLYGSDLYVQTETLGATRTMRLWRCALTIAGGSFLVHEITPDSGQAAGTARGVAINRSTKVMAWSAGNPFVEQDDYITNGSAYLDSSWFDFALRERKLLLGIGVEGDFPTGSYVLFSFARNGADDDSDFISIGGTSESGVLDVSVLENPITFRTLKVRVRPGSTDVDVTPTIRSVQAIVYLIEYRRSVTLLLNCMDQTAAYHTDSQVPGSVLAENLFALAEAGTLVEYVDYFSSKRNEDARTYRAVVTDPQQNFLGRGESVIQVTLLER